MEILNRKSSSLLAKPVVWTFIQIICIQLFIALLLLFFVRPVYSQVPQSSIPLRMVAEWPINSETLAGEHFALRILEDVLDSKSKILIPANSRIIGTVVDVHEVSAFNERPRVDIKFQKIFFPDNKNFVTIDEEGLLTHSLEGSPVEDLLPVKFGGILGLGTSSASSLVIRSNDETDCSLISFLAKKQDEELDITPGLPMILSMNSMNQEEYQSLAFGSQDVDALSLNYDQEKLSIEISNNLRHSISLANLKIIDDSGSVTSPNISANQETSIPAKSNFIYEFSFKPSNPKAKYWLVLTDSLGKQEYFRKSIL